MIAGERSYPRVTGWRRRGLRVRLRGATGARAELRRHLANQPVLSRCRGDDLRRAVRWGDIVEVPAGRTLIREDTGNWWFFLVLAGEVRLTRGRRTVGIVGPGGHLGAAAIVGLRPQPVSATTTTTSIMFVLGPRFVLSLLAVSPGFQQGLFPDVEPGRFQEFERQARQEGQLEWARIPRTRPPWLPLTGGDPARRDVRSGPRTAASDARGKDRLPGRPLSLAEAAAVLTKTPIEPPPSSSVRTAVAHPIRMVGGCLAVILALLVGLLFGYHPPRVVVTPGPSFDAAADISVTGAPTRRPSARYLLLTVRIRQPNLAGWLDALARGEVTATPDPADRSASDRLAASRLGRRQYLDSQRAAITAALAEDGLDARRVRVSIRDRGLVGPSGGLIYALALADVLGRGPAARSPVVAATGAIEPDGAVEPIGWVTIKAAEAAADDAGVFLVPASEYPAVSGLVRGTVGVADLKEALLAVAGTRPAVARRP
ncbi:MAG TPA: cyclic nucleotide-binding domain-containing protein [Acidimicrobiales bacterium]|nr:cyclic nucleotide-binding domain-containing protein [Acidimicrobiales bacterium]